MTYETLESSVQDGNVEYRFLFALGAVEYRYTTAQDTIAIADSNATTWVPAPITAGDVEQTGEMSKDDVEISLPRDNLFAVNFLGGVPEQVASVTIFRGHSDDGEFVTHWKGRVAGIDIGIDTIKFNCENIFTSMRRPGLRARYQKACRHALYQRGCTLDEATYAEAKTAIAASGFSLTVDNLVDSNHEDGYYVGGMVEDADGFFRFITSQSGDVLTLIRPLQSLLDTVDSTGVAVTVYPGCDKSRVTCKNKFDNLDNFGGFPWIPSKNPFGNDVSGSIV